MDFSTIGERKFGVFIPAPALAVITTQRLFYICFLDAGISGDGGSH